MSDLSNHLHTLNPAQQQAIQHGDGPALVLAGAGSGKTTVLTTRAAWLIHEQHVPSNQLLLVTFTNKAAAAMRAKVEKLTQEKLTFASTFHSFCARLLRQYGYAIGLQPGFSIYDDDDQLSIIKRILKDKKVDPKKVTPRTVKAQISRAKNEMISAEQYREFANSYLQQEIADLYDAYQSALQEAQAADFDDLLLRVVELLKTNPDILEKLQATFLQVLVDEYQDTNKAQYQLTQLLAAPHNNLFVVGDFAQSIYSWRGADYRNMLQLKQDYPNITEYKLEQNYRSTQTILDAASQVIALNTAHPVLTLWTERTESLPITLKELPDTRAEAAQVARWIIENHRDYPLADMAILYRTNAQSRAFEDIFIRSSIPYRIVGGVSFYERKEVKDLLAYLRLYANPQDEASLIRAEKIGKRKLQSFITWRDAQFATSLKQQSGHGTATTPDHTNPSQLVTEILKETQYLDLYDVKDPEDAARLENIQELSSVAAQFQSLTQMLENISLMQDGFFSDISQEANDDAIQLMSLHSAKGLEFSVVFLVGLEDGLLPHSRSLMDPDALEEERRLCYVGITRAKHKLYLTYTKSRYVYNSVTTNIPSRFLKDISVDLLSQDSYPHTSQPNNARRLVIDEDMLAGVLTGEIDIDNFINS